MLIWMDSVDKASNYIKAPLVTTLMFYELKLWALNGSSVSPKFEIRLEFGLHLDGNRTENCKVFCPAAHVAIHSRYKLWPLKLACIV